MLPEPLLRLILQLGKVTSLCSTAQSKTPMPSPRRKEGVTGRQPQEGP